MLDYYLGKPDYLDCIGYVYPIKIENYEKFQDCCRLLYISRHNYPECDYPLLDLVLASAKSINMKEVEVIEKLQQLFILALRKEVKFKYSDDYYLFMTEDGHAVNKYNYDCIRKTIMQQNLMFEPKVYKNKLVQEWAEKVMEARAKNGVQTSIEDMCSTVVVFKGIHPYEIGQYSIYQLFADYYRIRYLKGFDVSVSAKCAGSEKTVIEDFAKEIDLLKNPYDDLFVEKDKLKNINNAISN
jgi:putative component of toxin-antitoxin plasmid stabilization module